jgi:hypothetical protein
VIIGEAANLVIIPVMFLMQGIAILIHVIIVVFKLVVVPVPTMPTLIAAP